MAKLVQLSINSYSLFPSKEKRYHANIVTEENNQKDYHFINFKIQSIGKHKGVVDSYMQEELTKVVSILKTKKDKEAVINIYQKALQDTRGMFDKKLTKKDFGGWLVEKYEIVEF